MYTALGEAEYRIPAATIQVCPEHCAENFPGDPVCLVDCHCYNSCWLLYENADDVMACTAECQAALEPKSPGGATEQPQTGGNKYLYFGVGAVVGLAAGAIAGYMAG